MMDCKKALDEAEGDVDKAVEVLRIKGQKGVAKREGRSAENGAVVALIADDNTSGVIVELKCETDFVAKGDKFQAVANNLAAHVAATAPADIEALLASEIKAGKTVQAYVDEANANLGEKIVLDRFAQFAGASSPRTCTARCRTCRRRSVSSSSWTRPTPPSPRASPSTSPPSRRSTSPARMFRPRSSRPSVVSPRRPPAPRASPRPRSRKIVEGRVNGFFKEATLLGQPYALDNKKSVEKVLDEAGVTLSASRASRSASEVRTAIDGGHR
ncbi:Elongation factor Ts OS=Streptomyces alboniger OX=132473 GN=tsf PE=3 SV=1 [Streptomyces alboniger]